MILNLNICRRLGVTEVCKDHGLQLHCLIIWTLQVLVHVALAQVGEPVHVLLGGQAVLEHALALMEPALCEVIHLGQRLPAALANALEDLGHISHVEGVVGLGRGGQELLQHRAIDFQRGGDGARCRTQHVSGHHAHELVHHRHEDAAQALLIEGCHEEEVEPPGVAVRDIVLPPAGGAHGRQHVDVDQLSELPALPVIPAISHGRQNEHLAQDLDRRLGAILLFEGHVQVVDEDQHLLPGRRPESALLALVQLAVNHILGLVGRGLRGEGEGVGGVAVRAEALEQHALDGGCLGSTCGPGDQDVVALLDQGADQELVAAGVRGRHHDGVVRRVLGDVEALDALRPGLPLPALHGVDEGVVQQALAGRRWHGAAPGDVQLGEVRHEVELLQQVLLVVHAGADDVAHEQAALGVRAGGAGPGHGEPEELVDHDLTIHEALAHVRVLIALFAFRHLHLRLAEHLGLVAHQGVHHAGGHAAQPAVRDREGRLHLVGALQHHLEVIVEEPRQLLMVLLLEVIGHRRQPGIHNGPPAQVRVRLQEDDAHAAHRGRGRVVQVPDLEQHGGDGGELDNLATVQAELLVVVQHGVHVLDPNGIHWAVQDHPLALAIPEGLHRLSHCDGQHAIRPLLGVQVTLAVELALGDGLWVHHVLSHRHHLLPVGQLAQGFGQHVLHVGLAAGGDAHRHEPVAHQHGLPELNDLGGEGLGGLQAPLLRDLIDGGHQLSRVARGQLHPGEQIPDDALEERQIRRGELGEVHICEGPQSDDVLWVLVPVCSLAVTAGHQQGVQAPHAEVVVALRAQLL
mmetsp:Transcript_75508/g.180374  ORF Transcript_75508/g.180374 Transcript_75508/m.180374 type:complete len:801 (-) Transcript_75508:7569-9971(-)